MYVLYSLEQISDKQNIKYKRNKFINPNLLSTVNISQD